MQGHTYVTCQHGSEAVADCREPDDLSDLPRLRLGLEGITVTLTPEHVHGCGRRTVDGRTIEFAQELARAAWDYYRSVERIYLTERAIANEGDDSEVNEAA